MTLGAMRPVACSWKPRLPFIQCRKDLFLTLRTHQGIHRHHHTYSPCRSYDPQCLLGMFLAIGLCLGEISTKELMNPGQWPQLNLTGPDRYTPTSKGEITLAFKESCSPFEITDTNRHRSSSRGQGDVIVDEMCRQISPRLTLSPRVISSGLADTSQYNTVMARI